ncbi:MAG TPA: GNAT family N-acetyltransferase [Terriglobales bacterium]|nr:GNAT family N-acetyltransferase [Terriglobales bacterium]
MPPASIPYDAVVEHRCGDFLISTDRTLIDLEAVYRFLTNCYWAKGIPRDVVARSIEHSLCFGVYRGTRQAGFARVISDYATYAYIGDVFILEEHRGLGLGRQLIEAIMQHPSLQGLRRWSLVTRDAHGLYQPFGFTPLHAPDRWMEVHNPDVYKNSDKCSGA